MSTAQWTNLTTLKDAVTRVLGSVNSKKLEPTGDDQEDATRDSLDELSKIRPQVRVTDIAGDGTKVRYIIRDDVTGWDDDLSTLEVLEIITDKETDDESRRVLEADDYELRPQADEKLVLKLLNAKVAGTGEDLRITWTHPLDVDGLDGKTTTTVPGRWKQVLILLACERLAYLIARKASDLADNTMGIDQVEFRTFDRRWKDRAMELRVRLVERLAPTELGATNPGTSIEYETRSRLYGKRITH